MVRLQGQGGPGGSLQENPLWPKLRAREAGKGEKGEKGKRGKRRKIRVQGVPDLVSVFFHLPRGFYGFRAGLGEVPQPKSQPRMVWMGLSLAFITEINSVFPCQGFPQPAGREGTLPNCPKHPWLSPHCAKDPTGLKP